MDGKTTSNKTDSGDLNETYLDTDSYPPNLELSSNTLEQLLSDNDLTAQLTTEILGSPNLEELLMRSPTKADLQNLLGNILRTTQ